MKISPKDVFLFIKRLFDDDGWRADFCTIKCDGDIEINIVTINGVVRINFPDNKPTVSLTKFALASFDIETILLKDDKGVLVIDGFPDIPFKYDR